MNRYYSTTVESIRSSQRRAFDSSASANMFSELIDKHGRHDWLDPVLDSLGPYIQLQLGGTSTFRSDFFLVYIPIGVLRHVSRASLIVGPVL